ncbi:transcriptional regulator [Sesbania bispinosa]|nr:transcriptional regulator [Sesbania bispinosa]
MLPRTIAWLNEVENLSDEVQTLTHGVALLDASFNEIVVTLIAGLLLSYGDRAPNFDGGGSSSFFAKAPREESGQRLKRKMQSKSVS